MAREAATFQAGRFGVLDKDSNQASEFGFEYRFDSEALPWLRVDRLGPTLGIHTTSEEAVFVYGGLRYEQELGDRWTPIPAFSAGFFDKGNGMDLGLDLEFCSSLEVSYQLSGLFAIGVAFSHLSNGELGELNRGSESVLINLTWFLGQE